MTTDTQDDQSAIEIQPADPQVIYVPVYNPAYVWGPPVWGAYPDLWYPDGFGFGFGFGPASTSAAFSRAGEAGAAGDGAMDGLAVVCTAMVCSSTPASSIDMDSAAASWPEAYEGVPEFRRTRMPGPTIRDIEGAFPTLTGPSRAGSIRTGLPAAERAALSSAATGAKSTAAAERATRSRAAAVGR